MKVKVISLAYIFQVLYVLCFTRPRYQVSVYRTIGPLVILYRVAALLRQKAGFLVLRLIHKLILLYCTCMRENANGMQMRYSENIFSFVFASCRLSHSESNHILSI